MKKELHFRTEDWTKFDSRFAAAAALDCIFLVVNILYILTPRTPCATYSRGSENKKRGGIRQSGRYALAPPPLPGGPTETLQTSRFAPYRVLAARRAKHCSSRLRCGSALSQRASAATLVRFAHVAAQYWGKGEAPFPGPLTPSIHNSLMACRSFFSCF